MARTVNAKGMVSLQGQVPPELADTVETDAKRHNSTLGDWVANIVAEKYNFSLAQSRMKATLAAFSADPSIMAALRELIESENQ